MVPTILVVGLASLDASLEIPKSDIFPSRLWDNRILLLFTSRWIMLHPWCRYASPTWEPLFQDMYYTRNYRLNWKLLEFHYLLQHQIKSVTSQAISVLVIAFFLLLTIKQSKSIKNPLMNVNTIFISFKLYEWGFWWVYYTNM